MLCSLVLANLGPCEFLVILITNNKYIINNFNSNEGINLVKVSSGWQATGDRDWGQAACTSYYYAYFYEYKPAGATPLLLYAARQVYRQRESLPRCRAGHTRPTEFARLKGRSERKVLKVWGGPNCPGVAALLPSYCPAIAPRCRAGGTPIAPQRGPNAPAFDSPLTGCAGQ